MATLSPILAMTRARREAYSSGGKTSVKTGCAASLTTINTPGKNPLTIICIVGRTFGLRAPLGPATASFGAVAGARKENVSSRAEVGASQQKGQPVLGRQVAVHISNRSVKLG